MQSLKIGSVHPENLQGLELLGSMGWTVKCNRWWAGKFFLVERVEPEGKLEGDFIAIARTLKS